MMTIAIALGRGLAVGAGLLLLSCTANPPASVNSIAPTAIFHAFNQPYSEVAGMVCTLAEQGYSHVQISPAQKSNSGSEWWKRYQPVDHSVIEGLGSAADVAALVDRAAGCDVRIIADVVFNHMANLDHGEGAEDLSKYPNLSPSDFNIAPEDSPGAIGQKPCSINYSDGDRTTEVDCWLGGLPDLRFTDNVKAIHKAHLKRLLELGVGGFRFDAAKHMPPEILAEYIDYIDQESGGAAWSYLEVIQDNDTRPEVYGQIAPLTDFSVYRSLKAAFTYGGDLRSLPPPAIDARSVTFGRNHDTITALNSHAIDPYDDPTDAYLATAYVLAQQRGTPLVFNEDNMAAAYVPAGVKFRQVMRQRQAAGRDTAETVLRVLDQPTAVLMARGAEGFFVVNKAAEGLDLPVLDVTLSPIEGCYRELRYGFTVTVESQDGKKRLIQWGSGRRGLQMSDRDALYFVREPLARCQ